MNFCFVLPLLLQTIKKHMEKAASKGILLMNLGSPDSTEVKDVRRYLNEFLMDERVIDYPYLLRLLLVKGIITRFRAPKSAEAYSTIWTKEGSPLIVLTKQLRDAVDNKVDMPVEIAMRYGNPTVKYALDRLLEQHPHLDEVIAVPLYPHYAMSSYETAVESAKDTHKKNKYPFKLSFIKPYYNEDHYITAMAENMRPYLEKDYDHILFSYHGIPESHLKKSDPTKNHCLKTADCCSVDSTAHATCYRHQCFVTTELIAAKLGLKKEKYSISFQSRLAGEQWLTPYTDYRLRDMPKEGVKKLLVLCPAFVSDCLETLEEIAERGKETFMEAGGEEYSMIPCMNVHPLWVQAIANYVEGVANGEREMVL
jgi:ferrochelatase